MISGLNGAKLWSQKRQKDCKKWINEQAENAKLKKIYDDAASLERETKNARMSNTRTYTVVVAASESQQEKEASRRVNKSRKARWKGQNGEAAWQARLHWMLVICGRRHVGRTDGELCAGEPESARRAMVKQRRRSPKQKKKTTRTKKLRAGGRPERDRIGEQKKIETERKRERYVWQRVRKIRRKKNETDTDKVWPSKKTKVHLGKMAVDFTDSQGYTLPRSCRLFHRLFFSAPSTPPFAAAAVTIYFSFFFSYSYSPARRESAVQSGE